MAELSAPAPDREQLLRETLREWASSPCERRPCALAAWRYACTLSGLPVPPLPYHQSRGAMLHLLRRQGGFAAYAARLAQSIGWIETFNPQRGDVGLIDIPEAGMTAAICLGDKWLVRGSRAAVALRAPLVAAWRAG